MTHQNSRSEDSTATSDHGHDGENEERRVAITFTTPDSNVMTDTQALIPGNPTRDSQRGRGGNGNPEESVPENQNGQTDEQGNNDGKLSSNKESTKSNKNSPRGWEGISSIPSTDRNGINSGTTDNNKNYMYAVATT